MDSALISESLVTASTSTDGFIEAFQSILTDNFLLVLAFAAGVLVWAVLKKWVFGSSGRV